VDDPSSNLAEETPPPQPVLGYENPRDAAKRQAETRAGFLRFEPGKVEDNAWSFSIAGSVAYFLISLIGSEEPLFIFFAECMLGMMLIGVGCSIACILNPKLRRQERRNWAGGLIAVGGALVMTIGIQSCPHATYLRFGPTLTTISGQRCGNPQPLQFWWMPSRR
jgi:hypothetical protein